MLKTVKPVVQVAFVNNGVLLCGHDLFNSVRNFSVRFSVRKVGRETVTKWELQFRGKKMKSIESEL